jgi:hypothetical protein
VRWLWNNAQSSIQMKRTACMNFWHEFLTFFTLFDCIAFPQKEWKLEASHVSQTQQQTPLLNATKKPPPSLPKLRGIEKLSVFHISNLTRANKLIQLVGSLEV